MHQKNLLATYTRKIVCVYDQLLYKKAFQIKCKELNKFQELFSIMGTFHVTLEFLIVIGARLKDVGLRDIVAQGFLVTKGLVKTIFSESHSCSRPSSIQKTLGNIFKDPVR